MLLGKWVGHRQQTTPVSTSRTSLSLWNSAAHLAVRFGQENTSALSVCWRKTTFLPPSCPRSRAGRAAAALTPAQHPSPTPRRCSSSACGQVSSTCNCFRQIYSSGSLAHRHALASPRAGFRSTLLQLWSELWTSIFSFPTSHQRGICIAWQGDWGWGDSNIYHQPFKAKNKIYPATLTMASSPSPVRAGVGSKGEHVKAEFNKVFKPMEPQELNKVVASRNQRSSQFHEPYPVPTDRLVHTSAPTPSHERLWISEFTEHASRAILAGMICAVRALQIRISSIYITLYQKLMTLNYINYFLKSQYN